MARQRATRTPKAFRFDWTFVFCVLVLCLAPISSVFWFFIPVGVSLFLQTHFRFGQIACLASFLACFASPLWLDRALTGFDFLGLVLLFALGIALWGLRQNRQSFLTYLFWPLLAGAVSAITLIVATKLQSDSWSYSGWTREQMGSEIFPYFFHGDRYPDATKYLFDLFFLPVLQPALIAWFAALMGLAFFVNGLMENLLKSFRVANIRGQARVFDRLNHWKVSDYVLIPLVSALALLVANYVFYEGQVLWMQIVGWNTLILALFPLFIQGIAVFTFLIPRVNFLFVVILFMILIFTPLPVLVLAGLGDLWFDLRSKMNTPPQEGQD